MEDTKESLSWKEKTKTLLCAAGITVVIAYLFYDSWWALFVFPVVLVFVYKSCRNTKKSRRKGELSRQFLDAMRVVNAALLAGFSMENAWKEAQKEVELLYGRKSVMYGELQEINRSVELSVPLEQTLEAFARRSGVEEIISFSDVFSFAKRSGGDFVGMIGATTDHMRKKQDTENEIAVLIASRKLEQKVMNVIPIFILVYLRVSSGGYLDVLYKNPAGVIFMTICLAAYAAAICAADKIMAIRV